MTDYLWQFFMSFAGGFLGSASAMLLMYKPLVKHVGKIVGRDFAQGIDQHYSEREEKIKRKTF